MLVHGAVDPLVARQAMARGERVDVALVRERAALLRAHEEFLPVEGEFEVVIRLVVLDEFGERPDRGVRAERGEVGVQIRLELVVEHLHLVLVPEAQLLRERDGIDDGRALRPHGVERVLEQGVDAAVEAGVLAQDAEAGAGQAGRVESAGVVGHEVARARGGQRVAGVDADHRAEHDRGVAHGAGHRARAVLAVRDGDDPAPAVEPDRGLDADEAVARGRADDRAVRLGADRRDREVGRGARPGPRAGPARGAVERVRITAEAAPAAVPAAPAPARRPELERLPARPLAHVRLAEQERPGLPQPRRHERVLRRDRSAQRRRPGRRRHPIRRVDVVLEKDRDPVQRPPRARSRELAVEFLCDLQRVRVRLQHREQPRPPPVQRLDPLEVHLRDRPAGVRPRAHPLVYFVDRDFIEREVRHASRGFIRRSPGSQRRVIAPGRAATEGEQGAGRHAGAEEGSPIHFSHGSHPSVHLPGASDQVSDPSARRKSLGGTSRTHRLA